MARVSSSLRLTHPDGTLIDVGRGVANISTRRTKSAVSSLSRPKEVFQDFFLPRGYPSTVTSDYLEFQAWDTVQALCSYLRGILATRAVLEGLGVGDGSATSLAAATQWVARDGVGMLGQLLFASRFGDNFDTNAKPWRLFADVINDVALTLEMVSPLVPSLFLPITCLASLFKALCGVAAGATRASLTVHFARADNAADVATKEGTQETAVTLLGLLLGLTAARVIGHSALAVWAVFLLLTALHVLANYRAVTALRLTSLNPARLAAALRLAPRGKPTAASPAVVGAAEGVGFRAPPLFIGSDARLAANPALADVAAAAVGAAVREGRRWAVVVAADRGPQRVGCWRAACRAVCRGTEREAHVLLLKGAGEDDVWEGAVAGLVALGMAPNAAGTMSGGEIRRACSDAGWNAGRLAGRRGVWTVDAAV